jgi:putative tricarboxylic transport membrane protein
VTPGPGPAGPRPRTQAAIGAGLLALAAALWLEANRMPPPHIGGVGPSAALRLVGALLAGLGVAHLVGAWRQRAPAPPERGHHAALAWVLSALVGLMVVLGAGGGFVLGAAWLFVATARGFGEPIALKSIALGVGLCGLVYLFFTRALSLALPAGPFERLLLG